MKLRWIKKFRVKGGLILQEKVIQRYDDGCGHIDEIEKWIDVPTVVAVSAEGEIVREL